MLEEKFVSLCFKNVLVKIGIRVLTAVFSNAVPARKRFRLRRLPFLGCMFFFGLRAALGGDCLFTSLSVVAKCLESVQGNQQLPPPIECLLSELCAVRAPSPTLEQQLL